MFPDLSTVNTVAFDTETTGLNWREDQTVGLVLTWGMGPDETRYYPIRHTGGGNLEAAPVLRFFRDLFKRIDLRVVMHNAAFDLLFASKDGIEILGPIEDTQINEALIDENARSYSLDACCGRRGVQAKKGDPLYQHLAEVCGGKAERSQMENFHKLPGDDPLVVDYAAGDGTSTLQLWSAQQTELHRQNLGTVHTVECRLIPVLHRAKLRGVPIDEEELRRTRQQVVDMRDAAHVNVGLINVKSAAQVESYLQERISMGEAVPPWPRTRPSTRYPEGQNSFPAAYLESFEAGLRIVRVRKLSNLLSTFIDPMLERHIIRGMVYPSFSQTASDDYGTVTGRLSSFQPNMQQVPKRNKELGRLFRRSFIPPSGMVWWEADYSQCEYRLFAHYAKSEKLIRGYNEEGIDMHQMVAGLLDMPRSQAKNMNFGILYGMGDRSLAGHIGADLTTAKLKRAQYFLEIPEASDFSSKAARAVRDRGYIRTLLGRRRRWPDNLRLKLAYQAINAICQGGNADIMKAKMVEIDDFFEATGRGHLGFSVHDAANFFTPVGDQETPKEVCRIMTDFSQGFFAGKPLRVRMEVDSGSGANWAEASYGTE